MIDLFGSERRTWCTKLTPEECRERLAKELAPLWGLLGSAGRPLTGRASKRGFDVIRFIAYHSFAQTHATGAFEEWAGVMRIHVRLGASPVAQVGMAVYTGATTALGIFLLLHSLPVGLVLPVMGLMIYGALRWAARSEADYLVERLKEILEAFDCAG